MKNNFITSYIVYPNLNWILHFLSVYYKRLKSEALSALKIEQTQVHPLMKLSPLIKQFAQPPCSSSFKCISKWTSAFLQRAQSCLKKGTSHHYFTIMRKKYWGQTSLPMGFFPISRYVVNNIQVQIELYVLKIQVHIFENIRVAQLTLRVKLFWSIFLWSMVGRKWARHTKSQQCLTTQAVLHPLDHLIKPITALHLHVLLHGRVQAILSAFRSMKLDVNLHFWASYSNVTHCNEWEAIVEKKNWSHSVGVWARGRFMMWLHLSHNHWTKGMRGLKNPLKKAFIWGSLAMELFTLIMLLPFNEKWGIKYFWSELTSLQKLQYDLLGFYAS